MKRSDDDDDESEPHTKCFTSKKCCIGCTRQLGRLVVSKPCKIMDSSGSRFASIPQLVEEFIIRIQSVK